MNAGGEKGLLTVPVMQKPVVTNERGGEEMMVLQFKEGPSEPFTLSDKMNTQGKKHRQRGEQEGNYSSQVTREICMCR